MTDDERIEAMRPAAMAMNALVRAVLPALEAAAVAMVNAVESVRDHPAWAAFVESLRDEPGPLVGLDELRAEFGGPLPPARFDSEGGLRRE